LKRILGFLSIVLLIFTVACSGEDSLTGGNSGDTGNTGDSGSGDKTTIKFSYWGGDTDQARLEKIRDAFYEEYDDIEIELINLPEPPEYDQKQMVMMSSGESYDVIQLAESSYAFAARDVLEDLTPYIEEDDEIDLDDYYENVIDAYTHDDQIFGLPLRVGTMIMLYNKDLFDEHDLDYPNEDWTWDDVIAAGEEITDHDEGIFGVNPLGGWWASTAQFLFSHDASILNDDFTEFVLDSGNSLEAVELMQKITNDYEIAPTEAQIPEGIDMWTSGKQGMIIDGPWHIESSRENVTDFDWDMTVAPKGTQHATPIMSNAFHMPKMSENKEEAWEVIKFFTGKEAQEIFAAEQGETPTLKEVAESDIYLDIGDKDPQNFESIIEATENAVAPEASLMWTEINNEVVQDGLSRIIDLNEPVDEVMPGLRSEVEDLLEEAERLQELFDEGELDADLDE